MQEDNRVCQGNYDSAMHYDCNECSAKCSLRKESDRKVIIYWASVLFIIVALIVIIEVVR